MSLQGTFPDFSLAFKAIQKKRYKKCITTYVQLLTEEDLFMLKFPILKPHRHLNYYIISISIYVKKDSILMADVYSWCCNEGTEEA